MANINAYAQGGIGATYGVFGIGGISWGGGAQVDVSASSGVSSYDSITTSYGAGEAAEVQVSVGPFAWQAGGEGPPGSSQISWDYTAVGIGGSFGAGPGSSWFFGVGYNSDRGWGIYANGTRVTSEPGVPGPMATAGVVLNDLHLSTDYSNRPAAEMIHDSAAQAGEPSRYNVWEYDFPDPVAGINAPWQDPQFSPGPWPGDPVPLTSIPLVFYDAVVPPLDEWPTNPNFSLVPYLEQSQEFSERMVNMPSDEVPYLGNDYGDRTTTDKPTVDAVVNAYAMMLDAAAPDAPAVTAPDAPAFVAPADAATAAGSSEFPASGTLPIGYIDGPFQTATFDPLANANQQFFDAYGNSYATQAEADAIQDEIQDNDPDPGGYGDDDPIVLDLAGPLHLADAGIKITQLSSSNTFFDMTGAGRQNLTAWAGAGNGVLFFDPTAQGQLTQQKQIIFTAWDPGAKSDMQALSDVFDTNHDGSLDAGDTDFNDFYVMVTNANGTQTAYSLAQLGITSIGLTENATHIVLPDGSSIIGETSYTTASGGTGTAAAVTFAVDHDGKVIVTTTSSNADGSTTISNVALNDDGSVAYSRVLNTSSNGLSKTLTELNGGGVVTTLQTDNTVVNGDGSTTETLTNYAGGTIQANGELTASGVSGSEKLNSTTTTTSASGKVVTILRDQLGGGWTTQQEVDTTNADGSTSIVVSDLNPNGTTSNVTTTTVSANGLARTITGLVDGVAADSTTSVDQLTINGSTQTETVTKSAGATVTGLTTTITQTASNSVTRTTTSDLTDGTTLNLTSVSQTVTNSSGSTTTQTDRSANGTLLDRTVTTNTPQSGGGLVTTVVSSSLDGLGNFVELGSQTTTLSNAGATATTTVVNASRDGTQRSESITTTTVGSAAKTVTIYGNGDGAVTQLQTVTVSGGTTTATVENLNAGSLATETVTVTSNGGLSKTISIDSTGGGTASAPIFDHITTDITTTSGGASTETVADYGAAQVVSDEIDRTQTVTSANGLTKSIYSAFTATSLSGGAWDQISTDQTTVNSDGSVTETDTVTDGSGHVLETKQKATSANRQVITTTTTLGSTGLARQVETMAMQANGGVIDTVVDFDANGDVFHAVATTTSADGLVKTIKTDVQGQSAATYAASGLSFDNITTTSTGINADGSRTSVTNVLPATGIVVSTGSAVTSANGLSVTTTRNPFLTAHYASRSTDVTVINADGSRTETTSDYNFNAATVDQTTVTTSASGLSHTMFYDLNGDGVTDQSTTDVTIINANGSQTETVTDYIGGTGGTVRDVTTTTSGIIVANADRAGLETIITHQSNGSVPNYQIEYIVPSRDGTITDTTFYYASAGGALLKTTTVTTSNNGLDKVSGVIIGNADFSNDFWTSDSIVLNANGGRTETVATSNRAGLVSETVTTTSANGLSKTTQIDANGAVSGSNPIFDYTTTDTTSLNSNGSRTETVTATAGSGSTIQQSITTTSADKQTVATNRYLNLTGTITHIDQTETAQTQATGAVVDSVVSYNSAGSLLSTVTTTTSGNGLVNSKTYQNASAAVVDTQSNTETYDANGDGGTLIDFEDTDISSGTTVKSSVKTRTVVNGQTSTTTMTLTGAVAASLAASFSNVASASIAIADTGVTTATTVDVINGAANSSDTTTIVTTANGLTKTISTALGSASPYIVQQTSVALDGSKSQVTTYYDPASLSVVEERTTVSTSADGRTITTTTMSDCDLINQQMPRMQFTPAFGGSGYNIETSTVVENADDTTTNTVSGSGAFGATAYSRITSVATNADSSIAATTQNYDASGILVDQIVSDISPDGLVKSYAYDTTGREAPANLSLAAADIIAGSALPTSLLPTDIIESDVVTLNQDGSKTEVVRTAYGASFANQRSLMTTITSANGLVTTSFVSNDASGVYDSVSTVAKQADGSTVETDNAYNKYTGYGTQSIDGMSVGALLVSSATSTISANGSVKNVTSSTGVADTTVYFSNSNGSYEFNQTVTANSDAFNAGVVNESATHFVDANGLDAWSWVSDAYIWQSQSWVVNTSGAITIDVATEKQDIAAANEIYQTLLGRSMTSGDTQTLAQFISNGILNREGLAENIVVSQAYGNFVNINGTVVLRGANVLAALGNALGRLPTAEEMATFDQATSSSEFGTPPYSIDTFVPAAVAIAQYATDLGIQSNLTQVTANQALISPTGGWMDFTKDVDDAISGTYSSSNSLIYVRTFSGQYNTSTINGSYNLIYAACGSITLNGIANAIDINSVSDFNYAYPNQAITVNASSSSILVEDANIGIVSGNYDQIAQVGPSEVDLTSGVGDQIYIESGSQATVDLSAQSNAANAYGYSYSTTYASSAAITVGVGVGTTSAPVLIYGSSDTLVLLGNDAITLTGSGNTITVKGGNDTITASGATINIASGATNVVINGSGNSVSVSDTAANVSANIALLNSNASVSAITLTDAGTPTLTLTAAQVANDTTALSKITNATYSITVTDTAANVSTYIAALNANAHLTSITITGTGTQTLTLTAAQAEGNASAFSKISNAAYNVAVSDTAANIAASISALNGNAHLTSIVATDASVSAGVSTFNTDETALDKIVGGFVLSDQATAIQGDIDAIQNDVSHIAGSIIASSGTVTVSVASFLRDQTALDKIAGGFAVSDTAANVSAHLSALTGDGRLVTLTSINTDGSKTSTSYDRTASHPWTTEIASYNASGQLVSVTDNNDDGTRSVTNYDIAGTHTWVSQVFTYDSSGNQISVATNNRDGTQTGTYTNGNHWTTIFDAVNAYNWASYRLDYDVSGNLIGQTTINDYSTRIVNAYNPTPTAGTPWVSSTTVYDTLGRVVSQAGVNSDGSHWLTAYDNANAYSWATFTNTYDSDWNLLTQTTTNHDGTHTVNAGEIGAAMDTLVWYSTPYHPIPSLALQTGTNANGTTWSTLTDTTDAYGWNTITKNYTASGVLSSLIGTTDGGSSWTNIYDTTGTAAHTWEVKVSDANGNPVSWSGTNRSDGSHWLTVYDVNNQYVWSSFTNTYDSHWNLLTQTELNHDGSTTVNAASISVAMDTLTWYASPYDPTPTSPPAGNDGDGMPVILDLDGNGVNLAPLGTSNATFDMTGNGQPVPTAWAAPGDGFLAIDLGGSGVIDQAKQIEFTQWAPGTTSDMQALRQVFDTDQNGELDPSDALWSDFRIWQDTNSNGISDPGEVKTLDQLGITSINLNPTGPAQQFADGSIISGLSTYTRSDGTTGLAGDVGLAFDGSSAGGDGATTDSLIGTQFNQFVDAMARSTTGSGAVETISVPSVGAQNQMQTMAASLH